MQGPRKCQAGKAGPPLGPQLRKAVSNGKIKPLPNISFDTNGAPENCRDNTRPTISTPSALTMNFPGMTPPTSLPGGLGPNDPGVKAVRHQRNRETDIG